MDKPPAADDLARRLLDLWQDQITAMCEDPDLRDQLDRFLAPGAWQAGTSGCDAGLPAGECDGTEEDGEVSRRDGTAGPAAKDGANKDRASGAAAPGSEASSYSPEHRDRRLVQLEDRLAALEERIDRLAAGLEGERGAPEPRSR